MFRKYGLPILAAFGVIMGLKTVISGGKTPPAAQPVVEPPLVDYKSFVAGSGIVEASSENIAIASQLSGVVTQIFVTLGQEVKIGDPLFSIDSREVKAKIEIDQANLEVAKSQLANSKEQFSLYTSVQDRRAVSANEFTQKKNAVAIDAEKVKFAESTLKSSMVELDRHTVTAPIAGQILQIKTRLGEFAPANVMTSPLMILGATSPLHVRVDIDENDAWRVEKGVGGKAFFRGNANLSVPLAFVKFEPYVVPKRSLTGESSERVDTRVLQVLYSFDKKDLPIFVGQLMDVFIESSSR
jgi:HlyD family secretion protein